MRLSTINYSPLTIKKIMYINLQLPDSTYQRLITESSRIRGTIGYVSPTEANFNEHSKSAPQPGSLHLKLPHGRASVSEKNVRLSLVVSLDETDILPAQAIEDESRQASGFIDRVFEGAWE